MNASAILGFAIQDYEKISSQVANFDFFNF